MWQSSYVDVATQGFCHKLPEHRALDRRNPPVLEQQLSVNFGALLSWGLQHWAIPVDAIFPLPRGPAISILLLFLFFCFLFLSLILRLQARHSVASIISPLTGALLFASLFLRDFLFSWRITAPFFWTSVTMAFRLLLMFSRSSFRDFRHRFLGCSRC